MATEWHKGVMRGDNWRQYYDYLAQSKKWWRPPSMQEKYRAAFAPMSGRLAVQLGFSELWRYNENREASSLKCLFVKPDGITAGKLALMCAPPDLLNTSPATTAATTNPLRDNL